MEKKMREQLTFEDIPVTDPNTRDEDDDRLAGQNLKIYHLLVVLVFITNVHLSKISLKYTSRISDIRKWLKENKNQTVKCTYGKGGLNWYSIRKCRNV